MNLLHRSTWHPHHGTRVAHWHSWHHPWGHHVLHHLLPAHVKLGSSCWVSGRREKRIIRIHPTSCWHTTAGSCSLPHHLLLHGSHLSGKHGLVLLEDLLMHGHLRLNELLLLQTDLLQLSSIKTGLLRSISGSLVWILRNIHCRHLRHLWHHLRHHVWHCLGTHKTTK